MIKKKIKYEDFDGVEREETFYFNISKSELSKAQLSVDGGLDTKLNRIVETQNVAEITKVYEEFIDLSYGEKSDDGKFFRKSPEILANFKATAAYDALFMELISNTKCAVEFIKGVLPTDISKAVMEDQNIQKLVDETN